MGTGPSQAIDAFPHAGRRCSGPHQPTGTMVGRMVHPTQVTMSTATSLVACRPGQVWEEAAPASTALGTHPAPWACFDMGNRRSLSACDLLLGCFVYTLVKAEEEIWLVHMGCALNTETAV